MNETNHIDLLLVRYLLHEANAGEQGIVESWRAAAAENELYFTRFKSIWEASRNLAAINVPDENAAWQLFQKRIQAPQQNVRFISRFGWMRVAALFVLIVGASMTYWLLQEKPIRMITAQSTTGVKTDTLSDGSIITLNKNSLLTYPEAFKTNTRTVALQGEAFFKITPNKKKPFLIDVNDVRIKVLGTSFNVRTENGNTEVIVATGIVQVQKGKTVIELRSNEKVMVHRQDAVLRKEKELAQLYNYYQTREFVCDNTPLWKLVAVLNNAYNANIRIANPELRNLPLTATFPNESLDQILRVIRLTFNIQVERTGSAITLK